jgi:predicted RNA-binding Zn ribbon-like protein
MSRLSTESAGWATTAAALVNSAPRETDPPEKLESLADLGGLLEAAPEPSPPATAADLDAVRAVRSRLLAAFTAHDEVQLAAALNPLLATPWEMAPGPRPGEWALGPARGGDLAEWLGARAARALAELALAYGIERLHLCMAGDCLRAVADVSRNGARRYCSRTCANRMNTRRFRSAAPG